MITQQLKLWQEYYQNEANVILNRLEEIKQDMKYIETTIGIEKINLTDIDLMELSNEFKQYQTTQVVGSHLQLLIDYPYINRYNLLQKLSKKLLQEYNRLCIKAHNYEPILELRRSDLCTSKNNNSDTINVGMDINLAKRLYTKSFERLGETEKYHWYDEEMRKTLSIHFTVKVECKNCNNIIDINIWKHYPIMKSSDTFYEIGTSTLVDHGMNSFLYRLLDRKEALFKFWDFLSQNYKILSIEETW